MRKFTPLVHPCETLGLGWPKPGIPLRPEGEINGQMTTSSACMSNPLTERARLHAPAPLYRWCCPILLAWRNTEYRCWNPPVVCSCFRPLPSLRLSFSRLVAKKHTHRNLRLAGAGF